MRMSAHQVVTGVTPTLAVATSSALTSASATKDSTEMDVLVLVGKGCVISTLAGQAEVVGVLVPFLACSNSTWAHSTHL